MGIVPLTGGGVIAYYSNHGLQQIKPGEPASSGAAAFSLCGQGRRASEERKGSGEGVRASVRGQQEPQSPDSRLDRPAVKREKGRANKTPMGTIL